MRVTFSIIYNMAQLTRFLPAGHPVDVWCEGFSARPYDSFDESESSIFVNEPCHEIMVLSVLRKLILQTHMRSHPVGLA